MGEILARLDAAEEEQRLAEAECQHPRPRQFQDGGYTYAWCPDCGIRTNH